MAGHHTWFAYRSWWSTKNIAMEVGGALRCACCALQRCATAALLPCPCLCRGRTTNTQHPAPVSFLPAPPQERNRAYLAVMDVGRSLFERMAFRVGVRCAAGWLPGRQRISAAWGRRGRHPPPHSG